MFVYRKLIDYQDWYSFHDTFHSLIHSNPDLSNIQKFHYLKASLKGEAAEVLHSLEISSINYAEAWSLLTERYDHKRLIIQTHIKAIDNLPCALKENAGILRKILDGSLKHVRALKALERPVEYWDDLLVHLITKKLDPITNKEWEQKLTRSDIPTYKDITDFLMQRCHTLEAVLKTNSALPGETVKRKNTSSHVTTGPAACPICNKNNHLIYQCKEFLDLPSKQRLQRAKSKNLCVNCLRGNHQVNKCNSSACRTCNKRHNTLLHFEEEPKPSTSSNTFVTHSSATNQIFQTFLSTAIINVFDKNHKIQRCRALLDSGSQSNFITKALAEELGLKQNNIHLPVIGINNSFAKVNKMLSIKLSSRYNAFQTNLDCLVIENICQNLPQFSIHKSSIAIPDNIKLADPEFHISSKIDMLIGSDLFWKLLCVGQIKTSPKQPYLQKTLLGWIVAGRYSVNNLVSQKTLCNLSIQVLQTQLTKFWELEECLQTKPLTAQERQCEQIFANTYSRNQQGRFIVHLPLKTSTGQLGDSRNVALKRLYTLENKLNRQPQLREEYNKFMSEYITLGHMKLVPVTSASANEKGFYLPHHAVFKETSTTTKLRVVFDGSAKTSNGISLNDLMLVGPTLQDDLLTIITRFRNYQYVVTADISKMYRQILVHESQTPLQRILWRFSTNQPIQTYELQTVTYGTASASYLAIKSLQQLAYDEGTHYQIGASIALRDFYVDDLLTGANTVHEVKTIVDEVCNLLSKGGFELRKWSTNHPSLLKDIPETSKESVIVNLNKEPITHALGLQWNSQTDTLQYAISSATSTGKITKRSILSKTAQIFDPLGLVGPVIIRAKIIMQELWLLNIDWDESVPTQVHSAWEELEREFVLLNELRIPRQATIRNYSSPIEICGFCDASERAYGACIYLRTINNQGYIESRLLCAKSRDAPTKNISLPRLELCGALLLARLVDKMSRALSTYEKKFYLWSDSTIVLSWIRSSARNWKTFVANRVGEIQTLTTSNNWNHVNTSENPADIISRGALPSLLIYNKLWWNGPEWLNQSKEFWPEQISYLQDIEEIEEYRPPTIALISTNHLVANLIDRYSNFQKLLRVSAYCYRFGWNLLCRIRGNKDGVLVGPIKSSEISFITKIFIKEVQESTLSKELSNLKRNAEIPCNSSLRCLNPFLDEDDIIRVGGRLHNSQLTYDKKHPIVLPSNHNFSKLLVSYEHRKQLHAGPLATLAAIRANYWPLSARSLVRNVIHKCIPCYKARPRQVHQLMGNLPLNRVTPARAFINSGVDYCGPFQVREGTLRRAQTTKAYAAIFICFATKAVHIELVSNLSTEAFINALKRFMSRRGKVSNLYSDNGTNFVGANRELKVLNELFKAESQHKIIDALAEDNINWSFIPPRSPHFGGLWEAAVKSAKHHIKRVLGNTVLNFEELYTLLTQIEAILNSRPITPLSNDASDLSFLCPGHFLIGDSLTSTVEPDLSHVKLNRLSRWQHVEYMKQHFWKRWSKEYLSQIQERTKWSQGSVQPQVGQLALIREDDVPPFKWVTGRIEMLHPGSDGVARVATLRTSKDTIKRAAHRLCILPIEVTSQE